MSYVLTTIRGLIIRDNEPCFHHITAKHFPNGISIPYLEEWLNLSSEDNNSLKTFEFTIPMSRPLTPHRFRIYYTCGKTSLHCRTVKHNLVVCRLAKKPGNENRLVNMQTGDELHAWKGIYW
jgi:hypothetical protein